MGLAHLRPVKGAPDAHKHYLEAEYELLVLSVNPDTCPIPDPDKVAEGYPVLSPYEVVVQFHGVGDLDAVRILERVIGGIVDGKLVPDEKWRPHWQDCVWDIVREFQASRKPN